MILVVNAGSSNTKFAIYDIGSDEPAYRAQVPTIQDLFAWLKSDGKRYKISAIGHRIVHGGQEFYKPTILTKQIIQKLKLLNPLAPLHQPYNLAAVEYFMQEYPGIVQIGCFDTAFHVTQNALAKLFAVPSALTEQGVIRYGFHGLSYEYVASILEQKIGSRARDRVIVAHLGNGASICALHNLQSVATTMGFSALDGLMMGTRCGSIDPGVLLYLLQAQRYTTEHLSEFLYNNCGLLGVSGISNDVAKLTASANESAALAIDLFCYRAACELSKLLVDIQGCDAIIFTAGIGENSSIVREKICKSLQWLGVALDQELNRANKKIISSADSQVLVCVIPTNEELVIAKHTGMFLKQ